MPFRLPPLREVKQGVHAPIGLQLVVPIEVGVNVQEIAGRAHVRPATNEIGVGKQAIDAGQRFKEKRELARVELSQHLAKEVRKLGLIMLVAAAIVLVVALDPPDVIVTGEGSRQRVRHVFRKEVVDADVREGRGALIFLRAPDGHLRIARVIENSERARPGDIAFGGARVAGRYHKKRSISHGYQNTARIMPPDKILHPELTLMLASLCCNAQPQDSNETPFKP